MWKNYVTTAIRALGKNKLFSAINLFGLAIGLAAAVLIVSYVRHELSYDRWIPGYETVYRLDVTGNLPGRPPMRTAMAPFPAVAAFAEEVPGVAAWTRVRGQNWSIAVEDRAFTQQVQLVDRSFFDVFPLTVVRGDPARALADPSAFVLTETAARKIFGDVDPIGRSVTVNGAHDARVTAVIADLPANSHFDIEALAPIDSPAHSGWAQIQNVWGMLSASAYVRFDSTEAARRAAGGLADFAVKYDLQDLRAEIGAGKPAFDYHLLALADLHVTASGLGNPKPTTDVAALFGFLGIAALILAMAAINFTNLALARSMQRAKEVAVRKVMGAERRQLMVQFLGESVLTAAVALFIGLALAEFTLPAFEWLVGRELELGLFSDPLALPLAAALAVLVGLGGGAYPALVVSGFRPASILKGEAAERRSNRLRATLVVAQFAASIALIACTAIVYSQIEYTRSADLGFDGDAVIRLAGLGRADMRERVPALEAAIERLPGVVAATPVSATPGEPDQYNTTLTPAGSPDPVMVETQAVGLDYFRMLAIAPIAGRVFSETLGADALSGEPGSQTMSVVLNRRAVAALGFGSAQAAVGQTATTEIDDQPVTLKVVGVVADIHHRSLREAVQPTVYLWDPSQTRQLMVKIDPAQLSSTLAAIDGVWREFFPSLPIRRSFIDESVAELYAEDLRRGGAFAAASLLAVAIACLGLFGLAAFSAERRTREIGIRKALGAKVSDLVQLMVWQFSKPVLWANLIGWPLAYLAMRDWLDGFAYRIALTPAPFLVAGTVALGIAWITVAGHALRVARSNPAKALKYE